MTNIMKVKGFCLFRSLIISAGKGRRKTACHSRKGTGWEIRRPD